MLEQALGQGTGWEVARQLWNMAAPGTQQIIVAVTGYGQDDDRHRSGQAGCDLHLVRPVEPGVLIGHLERFRKALLTDC
jgi:two-component system CheB/CheR fusion protein